MSAPPAADPLPYSYSTGNAYSAFAKFDGKNYFAWRRNMETQLKALGQWEVVDGTISAPTPVVPATPTQDEVRELSAWKLRAARAYAEIVLRVGDDLGDVFATIDDPYNAWVMLETSYGSRQSGIQAVINAELTLARWDGQSPITTFRDHMKALRTRLAAAGLTITAPQFYQHFINSLPAEYDMVVAIHDPTPSNHSIDVLCDRFRAIELRKELRTTKVGGTAEDPVALLAKQKGSKGSGRSETGRGGTSEPSGGSRSSSRGKKANVTCYGCGKKGHYKHECRSPRKQGQGQNAPSTSGTNTHTSNSQGANAPANKPNPAKPAGGSLLCLMEPGEFAFSASTDGRAEYYIDTGASSHFIEEIAALHDYIPFEVPRSITTAENSTIKAFGSGTLKFATNTEGKEMKGELHNVYYIPDVRHRLISVGRLFSQGWEPRLSRNGFMLFDTKEHLIARAAMKNGVYPLTLQTIYPNFGLVAGEVDEEVSDEKLHERLEHEDEHPLSAFSTGEKSDAIGVYDWHRRMGHHSMKTIVDMANGAVTGMILKDVPGDPPKLDSCPSCALAKAQRLPFKTGRTRATMPLELIHGDLVGPMPVESVSRCKYGFVLMDDYSRASWVLPLRAKSDAPAEFEVWAAKMENGTGSTIKAVMFDNAKELVAGRMREYCEQKGIRINSSVPYSPSSNGVAERLVGVATNGTRAMLRDSSLPPRFWAEAMTTFMYLRNRTPTRANEGVTPYERFYGMKPDVGHIRTFGCTVRVTLPSEKLGKLEDRGAMGYLMGYKYEGGYRVWIPRIGVREVRDVTFYEGTAPILPDHGSTTEVRRDRVQVGLLPQTAPPATPAPHNVGDVSEDDDEEIGVPAAAQEKLTIRVPGRYHPRAPKPATTLADDSTDHVPSNLAGDTDDDALQYVGQVHHYPARSTRSGLVRHAEGAGALLAFGAFEEPNQAFNPTPSTPDPRTIRDALDAPDANEWRAAMDIEIENMRRLNVFKTVPRPLDMNIITPRWVFHRKFENGTLVKHKARLVARGFTQISGVDYNEAHLYAPVMRLESFRVLLTIAAWFDLDLRKFDVSAAYLHGEIDGDVYMEPPPGHGDGDSVWKLLKGLYGLKQAGRIWHESLKADMEELGFTQCHRDHAVFRIGKREKGNWAVCAFWVDDETGVGSREQLDRVADMFRRKYGISGEGELDWTLGMKVRRNFSRHTVSISQQSYIENLVERFGLYDAQTFTTPLTPGTVLTKDQCPKTPDEVNDMAGSRYRELIGSLQYASLATRPDITFAVNKLSQFLANPGRAHLNAALRVLRYLKGTKSRSLHLGGGFPDIAGFSDSDWGGDQDDRKSTSAYVFHLGYGAVSWKSKKQTSVALSSVEAEYMAMCQAAKEAVWLSGLLEELGMNLRTPLIIYGDNQGALALAMNPDSHPRSKHVDIQYHFTRELIHAGRITVKYLPTKLMIADALTKPLPRPQFEVLTEAMGVYLGLH